MSETQRYFCLPCGVDGASVDEDGCCATCGADAVIVGGNDHMARVGQIISRWEAHEEADRQDLPYMLWTEKKLTSALSDSLEKRQALAKEVERLQAMWRSRAEWAEGLTKREDKLALLENLVGVAKEIGHGKVPRNRAHQPCKICDALTALEAGDE